MATTIVPDPGPVNPDLDLATLLKEVHELYLSAQRDYDVCTDAQDCSYYGGVIDTCAQIENLMT